MDIGLLVLRVFVGGLFVAHGTQKLFGWFGGYGLEGTAGFMGSLRYRNPRLAALSTGVFETGAGLFLVAGLLTPLAAAVIVGVMINAIVSAKLSSGLIGGYELDATYAAAAVALAFTGAGAYSVDAVIGDAFSGSVWVLGGNAWGFAAVALGAVIGALVLAGRKPVREVESIPATQRAA
jgi:putative oxidoreductase